MLITNFSSSLFWLFFKRALRTYIATNLISTSVGPNKSFNKFLIIGIYSTEELFITKLVPLGCVTNFRRNSRSNFTILNYSSFGLSSSFIGVSMEFSSSWDLSVKNESLNMFSRISSDFANKFSNSRASIFCGLVLVEELAICLICLGVSNWFKVKAV